MENSESTTPQVETTPLSPSYSSENPEDARTIFWLKFIMGFFGWLLVNLLIWVMINPRNPSNELCFAVPFPLNLITLITLLVIRKTRAIGFGILGAIALNLLITLILGIFEQGACLIPFFIEL